MKQNLIMLTIIIIGAVLAIGLLTGCKFIKPLDGHGARGVRFLAV